MKKNLISFLAFLLVSPLFCTEGSIDALKEKVCRFQPSFVGWCSQEKALMLIDLTLELKPKVCVDIGVFGGSSLYPVAATLKFLDSGLIFGIDPWDKSETLKSFDPVRDQDSYKWWDDIDYPSSTTPI